MKKLALLLMAGATLLACTKDRDKSDCGNKVCTNEFRSIGIRFVDNKGAGADVTNFSVVNQRTGERVYASSAATIQTVKGAFIVADDGNTKSLSEAGDDLKVTGTSIATNQTKFAVIKASGGKCACHISKISGPDEVAFD